MLRYVLQRLAQFVPVFVIVTFAVLVAMRLGSGGPTQLAQRMLGGRASPAEVDALVREHHLDQNFVVQYGSWLGDFVRGDLGFSQANNMEVRNLIGPLVGVTALLGLYAIVFGLLIAIPLAVLQASRRGGWFDRTANVSSFLFIGVPTIVLAVLFKLLFNTRLGWFPALGTRIYPWDDLGGHIDNFFVPTLTLALPMAAIFARLLRNDLVATLQADFIGVARARGISPRRVLWAHALRNSLLSVVTAAGTQVGALVGGAIVVETYFDLDGLGSRLIRSVLVRDLFTVQSVIALVVLLVVITNLVVDLLYTVIDPRVRDVVAVAA